MTEWLHTLNIYDHRGPDHRAGNGPTRWGGPNSSVCQPATFLLGLGAFSLGSEIDAHRHSINNKRTKRSGVQWTVRSNFNSDTSWPKQSQPRHLKLRNGSQASKCKALYRAQGTEVPHTNQGVLCCVLSKYWWRNSLKYNTLGIFLKILGLLMSRAPK